MPCSQSDRPYAVGLPSVHLNSDSRHHTMPGSPSLPSGFFAALSPVQGHNGLAQASVSAGGENVQRIIALCIQSRKWSCSLQRNTFSEIIKHIHIKLNQEGFLQHFITTEILLHQINEIIDHLENARTSYFSSSSLPGFATRQLDARMISPRHEGYMLAPSKSICTQLPSGHNLKAFPEANENSFVTSKEPSSENHLRDTRNSSCVNDHNYNLPPEDIAICNVSNSTLEIPSRSTESTFSTYDMLKFHKGQQMPKCASGPNEIASCGLRDIRMSAVSQSTSLDVLSNWSNHDGQMNCKPQLSESLKIAPGNVLAMADMKFVAHGNHTLSSCNSQGASFTAASQKDHLVQPGRHLNGYFVGVHSPLADGNMLNVKETGISGAVNGLSQCHVQDLGCYQKSGMVGIPIPSSFMSAQGESFVSSDSVKVDHGSNRAATISQTVKLIPENLIVYKFLLLYHHVKECLVQRKECQSRGFQEMKKIIMSLIDCKSGCNPNCPQAHQVLSHHINCFISSCRFCILVREKAHKIGAEICKSCCPKAVIDVDGFSDTLSNPGSQHSLISNCQDIPPPKRTKKELQSNFDMCQSNGSGAVFSNQTSANPLMSKVPKGHVSATTLFDSKSSNMHMEPHPYACSSHGSSESVCEVGEPVSIGGRVELDCQSAMHADIISSCKGANKKTEPQPVKEVTVVKESTSLSADHYESESKVSKLKVKGLSLIEWFSADQVRKHLRSLNQSSDQSQNENVTNQDLQCLLDENICQLCKLPNLFFDPPAIYCGLCSNRVGRSRAYYVMTNPNRMHKGAVTEIYFCNPCYKGIHGDTIKFADVPILKAKLGKRRNDDCVLEPWVQCDKCSAWQHQICGLFNDKKNEGEKAEYTCPHCYLREIESDKREPLPSASFLGAKNLPKTKLSEHIEKRLSVRLKEEREERAKAQGLQFAEVLGAENLVVRVVSSLKKTLEVKRLFHDIFDDDSYAEVFPYKSKAIFLFQNSEGADVCLFAMYVQEYGSECPHPNQRHVYLSYLDSVKYFSPEIKAVTGEALRTFVYQEILIGYLDYCKKQGFTCFSIWSCPPVKRDDFILNCHPEKQKMPKQDKLRDWYQMMLQKATKENIITFKTNLYDKFFIPDSECEAKITAARLPYFDGDYWPGFAEDVLSKLQKVEEGKEPLEKGKSTISRRALKAVQRGDPTGSTKDILLMDKIGDAIRSTKENFILAYFHHACNRCCRTVVSGKRWVCTSCQNFQLCEKCHDAESKLEVKNKHPINRKEKHSFLAVELNCTTENKFDDDDDIIKSELDSRISFLNFCQGEHYQYDTLRRAKYSTMMILYHLHDAVGASSSDPCVNVGFELCNHTPAYDGHLQSTESKPKIAWKAEDLLKFLIHSSQCVSVNCENDICRKLKAIFHHGVICKIRCNGGCKVCMKMWGILKFHARNCRKSDCCVPRCLEIKDRIQLSKGKESQIYSHQDTEDFGIRKEGANMCRGIT